LVSSIPLDAISVMPRLRPTSSMPFGSSSIVPFGGSSPGTPIYGQTNDYEAAFSSWSSSSVKLSCSSPGGRSINSLSVTSSGACYIETHSLPLAGTVETEDSRDYPDRSKKNASVIRTRLPEKISSALSRYPPIELLCVDLLSLSPNSSAVAVSVPSENGNRNERVLVQLPWLCVYTKKDVFLLDITYETTGAAEVEGVILNILEPFEDILIGNAATNVLRVRQAPQKFNGYATLCPAGSMAMLTQNPSTGENVLCIYHGIGGRSSSRAPKSSVAPTSHHFRMEELADPNERMVDFCFCQSVGLPLLSSLTVAFLKVSGEVLFATPIVFRGTVVPSQLVAKTLEFLDSSLKESLPDSATSRQFRAAKQFLNDAFPYYGRANFVTAGQTTAAAVSNRSRSSSEVFNWPVQLQGPILLPPQLEESAYGGSAGIIEPFATEGDLAGLSIGRLEDMVDFAVVSPSSFVPRFKFESSNDSYELDQDLTIGHVVNRVDLACSSYSGEKKNAKDIKLIPDPIMDSVIHYMTGDKITSISTNATRIASNKVRENGSHGGDRRVFSPPSRRSKSRPKTTAWNSLDTTFIQGGQNPIVGAVISDDVQLGHILVARLSNGEMVAINLTETRHLRELENFAAPEQILAIQDGSTADISETEQRALTVLDQTQALTDIVQPLIRDVIKGITALAQVGGSATAQADVTPDVLAAVVGIESKCKKEIFLPLMTMNEHVSARKAEFKAVTTKQKLQLNALKEIIASLREKQNTVREKAEIMLQNSKSLADRSASVLQSSKDLLPTITQAEYDYFQEMKRLDEKSEIWKNEAERLSRKITSINDSAADTTSDLVNLSPQDQQNAGQLLNVSNVLLKRYEKKLASEELKLDGFAVDAGFVRDANQ